MATLIVPRAERLTLYPTLGWQVIDDIERYSVFGPGSLQEQPAKLDDEKKYLVARFYEVYPMGHHLGGTRHFDRCSVELRKGVAKTELAAWVTHMELHPWSHVRFNGFDEHGELLPGRAVRSPYIPMMATAEEQVMELAFGVLKYIIEHGDTAKEPTSDLFDCTLERIVRLSPGGTNDGMAVPVSVAPSTRDGARTSFEHFDEPHHLYLPRERGSVETMLENLPKRQIETPWALFTSTAGMPGQGSVQEDIRSEAELIDEGRAPNSSLFFFGRWAGDSHDDLSTLDKRVEAIKEATGPVGEWGKGQFERIARDYDRVGVDRMYWERVYLNRWRKSNAGAFDVEKVKTTLVIQDEPLKRGSFVTVGFDGARRRDATAIVLTEIPTGRQQIAGLWERPTDAVDWECDEQDVNGVMEQVFKDYDVWRAYCDPPYWVERVALWSGKWPDQVVEWWTNQQRKAAYMARAYAEAIDGEQIWYVGSGDHIDAMVRHISHAGRKELKITDDQGKPLWHLEKLNGLPQNTFDACMAGNLSWQARLDAITDGAKPRNRFGAPRRLY